MKTVFEVHMQCSANERTYLNLNAMISSDSTYVMGGVRGGVMGGVLEPCVVNGKA